MSPFANYKNFVSCVRKNRGKRNPKAYCATIMRKVEGKHGHKKKMMMKKHGG